MAFAPSPVPIGWRHRPVDTFRPLVTCFGRGDLRCREPDPRTAEQRTADARESRGSSEVGSRGGRMGGVRARRGGSSVAGYDML